MRRIRCGGRDRIAVRIGLAHQLSKPRKFGIELFGILSVELMNNIAEYRVARGIPGWITRAPSGIAARLAPALLRRSEAVMAGVALQLRVFRPNFSVRPGREPPQGLPELNGLPGSKFANVVPRIRSGGFTRLSRHFPVARHHIRKCIQFEEKIRVAGGDHFVIHGLFVVAKMAGEAFLTALRQIARIVHSESERFLMRPIALRVRAQPSGGWSMAAFATNALAQVERTASLAFRHIHCMACQTLGCSFGAA